MSTTEEVFLKVYHFEMRGEINSVTLRCLLFSISQKRGVWMLDRHKKIIRGLQTMKSMKTLQLMRKWLSTGKFLWANPL